MSTINPADLDIKLIGGVPTIVVKSTGAPYVAPAGPAEPRACLHNSHLLFPLPSHTCALPPHLRSPTSSTTTTPLSATTPLLCARSVAREKTRLTAESGARVAGASNKIGGPFVPKEEPSFLADRAAVYDEIIAAQNARLAAKPRQPIKITLPDGKVLDGISWETTPLAIATGISKGLAASVVVAKVAYSSRVGIEEADGLAMVNTGPEEEGVEGATAAKAELWDIVRPLEGDCTLELKKFDDKEGKMVFWHSSAHVLGECMECKYGAQLCIGPPTEEGFYYDAYMGDRSIQEGDIPVINTKAKQVCDAKQAFERIVLTKAQALRLFSDNPFKVQLISTKIPDGSYTTAYRCGPLIDLCRGPHVPTTGAIKAMEVTKHSASYWLGNTENDSLQRVYGISFPDTKLMKAHQTMVEEAKKRDHRLLGTKQELFFFHDLSPGSCFFMPHGARIFNRLTDHIRTEYRLRGFHEVVTPNMFNLDLWRISGHADHYLENMFTFQVEGADFGLKPMNCPGHCLMFDHRVRSYRELPLRLADFGVLHRNEFSGALTGLTRVRRFQQDDAHIFCRPDQIKEEVEAALDFMQAVYGVFGFSFELDLSTRPAKALGSVEVWERAEAMMAEALNGFGRPWKVNPGDGAFYGPKIDIKVFDALGRRHQCATIQLDFQLPIRFNLRYKARNVAEEEAAEAASGEKGEEGSGPTAAPDAAAAAPEAPAAAAAAAAVAAAPGGGGEEGGGVGGEAKKEGGGPFNGHSGKKREKVKKGGAAAGGGGGGGGGEEGGGVEGGAPPPAPPQQQQASQVTAMVERARAGVDELPVGYERPVIIHRAILGSVERFTAVLIEHTGGKWPFWLSPRQISIVPVALKYLPYANSVAARLHGEGYYVDVDASNHTLNKKIREAQVEQYNFIVVVGEEEEGAGTVNIRTRANERVGTMPIADFLAHCRKQMVEHL